MAQEAGVDAASGKPTFATSELNRQVLLGMRQVDVSDYQVVNAYTLLAEGCVAVRQRTAVFLDPRQERYFSAAGRAVALYDYDVVLMRRRPADGESVGGAVACVQTPKDFVQCI